MTTVPTNIVYRQLCESEAKIIVEQGGTRSGKTYNILLWIVFHYCARHRGKVISICRQTFPALRHSAMRDFFSLLDTHGLYQPAQHSRTHHTYTLNGNLIEFVALDEAQKVRGRKRHLLFLNEANEVAYPMWQQLLIRTEERIILDFNPSDPFHWIYDKVIPRNDARLFITTYRDNPFLPEALVQEIERLQTDDPDAWRVFGQGERATSRIAIYWRWRPFTTAPTYESTAYGIDFGFNNPTALVQVGLYDGELYWQELLYQTRLTNTELCDWLLQHLPKRAAIYADSAEPARIAELRRAGLRVYPAVKQVRYGIGLVQSYPLYVQGDNLIREIKGYRWQTDPNEQPLDEPIKLHDHALDAARYASVGLLQKPGGALRLKLHG